MPGSAASAASCAASRAARAESQGHALAHCLLTVYLCMPGSGRSRGCTLTWRAPVHRAVDDRWQPRLLLAHQLEPRGAEPRAAPAGQGCALALRVRHGLGPGGYCILRYTYAGPRSTKGASLHISRFVRARGVVPVHNGLWQLISRSNRGHINSGIEGCGLTAPQPHQTCSSAPRQRWQPITWTRKDGVL